MGRQTFERTLADPQSLADLDYEADVADYEGYHCLFILLKLVAATVVIGLIARRAKAKCEVKP